MTRRPPRRRIIYPHFYYWFRCVLRRFNGLFNKHHSNLSVSRIEKTSRQRRIWAGERPTLALHMPSHRAGEPFAAVGWGREQLRA
jgi:hypothetical protein